MADMDEGDAEEAPAEEYSWERSFERTWEAVEVGPDGVMRSAAGLHWRSARRTVQVGVKRGMLRALFVVLDCSRNAAGQNGEMRPSRLDVMQSVVADLIGRYFEQNPISSLALMASRDGKAELMTEPSSNARQHLQALGRLMVSACRGDFSPQNSGA